MQVCYQCLSGFPTYDALVAHACPGTPSVEGLASLLDQEYRNNKRLRDESTPANDNDAEIDNSYTRISSLERLLIIHIIRRDLEEDGADGALGYFGTLMNQVAGTQPI